MATETTYTQAQYDGAGRALTRTLAELRERTDECDGLRARVDTQREELRRVTMQREEFMAERDDLLSRFAQECAARDRALEAVRGMRGTDELLRAQVEGLEKLRDGYAKERDALRVELAWWVNEEREAMMHIALSVRPDGEAGFHADYERARALLDGAA